MYSIMSDEASKIKGYKRRLFKELRDPKYKQKREPNEKKEYRREHRNYKRDYEDGDLE